MNSYSISAIVIHTSSSQTTGPARQTRTRVGELDSAATKLELLLTSGLAEADWLTLNEILLSLTSDGKTWFDMTDGEADLLREIATQEENTLAKL